MDLLITFYSVLLTVFLYFEGTFSIVVTEEVSPIKPVLGSSFTLRCSFTIAAGSEVAGTSILLKRKRSGEAVFNDIVSFPFFTWNVFNATYTDKSLETRTVASKPENSESSSVSLSFSSAECGDAAQYKWIVKYTTGLDQEEERPSNVTIKVPATFSGSSDYGLKHIPASEVVSEGDNVTFTCKAEVGNESPGQLAWYYYLNGVAPAYAVSDQASKGQLVPFQTCSYTQESTLVWTMSPQFNGVVVRCALQQDDYTAEGDHHQQTKPFNVTYSPRRTTIDSVPFYSEYSEGEAQLTLTCSSTANPPPSYTWLLRNGTEVAGPTYTLQNLQINDTGTYTCVAKNGVPDENTTDTKVLQLTVVEKTTTIASTTPSTPAATSPKATPDGGVTSPSTENGMADTTIIIIVVCVVVGVGIVIAIIVVVICKRKNKKPEIEEPPEKPRNNQDLTFHGNRPGLTTSNEHLKNSGNNLNTSFNSFDSTDSKPRNDDGLMYVDLQFDDKPRSRRPIQMYDNGGSNTQYADIAMPRV